MSKQRAQTPDSKIPYLKYPERTHKAILLSTIFDSNKSPAKHTLNPYYQYSPPKPLPKQDLFEEQGVTSQSLQKNLLKQANNPNQRNPLYDPGEDEFEFDAFAADFDFHKYFQGASVQKNIQGHIQKNAVPPLDYQQSQPQIKIKPQAGLSNLNKTASDSKTPDKSALSSGKGYSVFNTKKVEPPLLTKLKGKIKNPKEAQVLAYKDLIDNKIKNLHSLPYEDLARVIYNKALFVHVCDAPDFLASNWRALGKYLNAPCKHDLERAWVLFLWIVQNLSVDPNVLLEEQTKKIEDVSEIFSSSSTIGQGFALVFKSIGHEMGLKIRIIEGYCKGFAYATGSAFQTKNHYWNTVDIEGKSHLVDSMMGSGHLDMSYQYVKEIDLFYFLTNSDKLLMTHFPEYAIWQLTENLSPKKSSKRLLMFTQNTLTSASTCSRIKPAS